MRLSSLCRDSLKNPKSLDIYNIYLADESINPYLPQMEVCIDASAENSYGGTVRSEFYYCTSKSATKNSADGSSELICAIPPYNLIL